MNHEYIGIVDDVLDEYRNKPNWRECIDASFEDVSGEGEILLIDGSQDAERLDTALRDALIDAGILDEDEADDMESESRSDYPFLNFATGDDEDDDSSWDYRDYFGECYECGRYFRGDGWGLPDELVCVGDDGYYCEDCICSNPDFYIDYLVEREGEEEVRFLTEDYFLNAGFEEFDNTEYDVYSDYDDATEKVVAIHEICPEADVVVFDRWTTFVRNFEAPEDEDEEDR